MRAFQIYGARRGGHFLQETPLISHYSLSLSLLLQETLADASRTLYTALDGKVYFQQVTVVVPDGWTAARCRVRVGEPREGTSFQVRNSVLCLILCCLNPHVLVLHGVHTECRLRLYDIMR